jgi:hypothetical protein
MRTPNIKYPPESRKLSTGLAVKMPIISRGAFIFLLGQYGL